MFKTHTYFEARCGGGACRNTVLDVNLTRYFNSDTTAWFRTTEKAFQAARDANWAVADGKLLCGGCAPKNTAADDEPAAKRMLTPVVFHTYHCDTCGGAYTDGESGDRAHLKERTLDEATLRTLTQLKWEVTETTPMQSEALFNIPGAPERTWEATCGECVAEAAWRERLAAVA